jgi:hypothetical protein
MKSSTSRELRMALAIAVGLAATCFGAALFAANFIPSETMLNSGPSGLKPAY